MDVETVLERMEPFRILQTRRHSQTAAIRLGPGDATSKKPSRHASSDQVVLVIEGELDAELEGEVRTLEPGDSVVIDAGTRHRLLNRGSKPVLAFTVYAPPAYAQAIA